MGQGKCTTEEVMLRQVSGPIRTYLVWLNKSSTMPQTVGNFYLIFLTLQLCHQLQSSADDFATFFSEEDAAISLRISNHPKWVFTLSRHWSIVPQ